MALAFTTSIPKFRITYALGTTMHITFLDLIQTTYASYGTLTAFKGICSFKDPDGIIFYQNAGWSLTAPTFNNPDTNGNTPTWTFGNIDIPVDSDGLAKAGDYEFSYICTFNNGTSFVLVTKKYTFDYISPEVEIEFDVDCDASELTSTDATVYDVVSGGVTYSPTVATISHTVKEPFGSGYTPTPGTTSDAVRVIGGGGTAGTDLWTKTWQTMISTVLSYNLSTWDVYTWIVVTDTVTGHNHIDVVCSDCDCDLRQCMLNLFNRWLAAKSGNRKLEMDLQTTWLEAVGYWVEYQTAKSCGLSTDSSCQKLKDLLASVDCSCTTDTSDSPVRIVAHSAGTGGGGTTPSTFVFWCDTTNPSGGNSGDIWYNYTTFHMFQNVGGTWNDLGSIQGATGATGAAGTSTSSADVLYNDISDSATGAGTGNTKLKTFSIPANTFVNNGEYIIVRALFQLAANDNGKTLQLVFNGDIVATYFTDALINASTQYVEMTGIVHRKTVATQLSSGGVSRYGGFTDTPVIGSHTADLTTAIDVDVYGQNSVASASDIICKQFSIEMHSYLSGVVLGATNFEQGIETLVGTVTTNVVFTSSFASTSYSINYRAYDSSNQPIAITITSKLVTGFSVTSPDSGTFEWSAILV